MKGMESGTSSHSRSPFARLYFFFQALAVGGWWLVLWRFPATRGFFLPDGAAWAELAAFVLPDLTLVAVGSAVAGWALHRDRPWATHLAWLVTGGVLYATLYCLAWAVLRDGGWWNVAAMAPAGLLSVLAAVDVTPSLRLFRPAAPAARLRHVLATTVRWCCSGAFSCW